MRAAFDIAEGDEIFNRYQKETEEEGVDGQGRVDGGERDMPRAQVLYQVRIRSRQHRTGEAAPGRAVRAVLPPEEGGGKGAGVQIVSW